KMLQQNGYLVFTDDEENPARLMFCVSRDDLYSLRVEREDLDNILRTILRLYTGVFTGLRPVDVQEMAIYTGYTEERVMELLKTLWRLHVIRFVPKNRSPMVFLTDNRLPDADVYISPGSYRARKETAARRLEAVFAYAADTERCRSVVLQSISGQKDAALRGVRICLAHKTGTVGEDGRRDFERIGRRNKSKDLRPVRCRARCRSQHDAGRGG
ncbi:MAG: RecQ family ATP-dependent DNA helicase, partial [Alistipes inops]